MPESRVLKIRQGKAGGGKGALIGEEVSFTLATGQDQTLFDGTGTGYVVRRLTPVECERLQGFPSGWTDVPYKGKEHPSDTPRYKACGEAIAKLGNNVAREYVKMPVDAGGKVIRIGDKLDGYGQTTVVKRLTLDDDGWFMTCENGFWFDFTAFTHHKPTVEKVMQEMLEKAVGYSDAHTTVALNAIAEYSAKLRLANDGKEQ